MALADEQGKFVFHGDNDHKKSIISILHKPDSMLLAPNPGEIPSSEIASVLALSLGLSVPKDKMVWPASKQPI